jgi:ATP-dependent Clp protease ATP-binding subunit ClpA
MAGALARQLTGREDALIRLDMSEYSEPHTVARIVGSPAGYVGYGEQPQLLAALRRNPAGVLLLDEIEKAHPAIHRLFLQVFDAGRLTDAAGESYSLSNITIIATANTGRERHGGVLGFTAASPQRRTALPWETLKGWFTTEFLNRFDEIVLFQPLAKDAAREILRTVVLARANRRLEAHGVTLELTPAAEDAVLQAGYSEEFGVRHLHRAFEDRIMSAVLARLDEPRASRIIRIDGPEVLRAAAE